MTRSITIKTGNNGVVLPDGRTYNAGDVAILTDEQFARLNPGLIGSLYDIGSDDSFGFSTITGADGTVELEDIASVTIYRTDSAPGDTVTITHTVDQTVSTLPLPSGIVLPITAGGRPFTIEIEAQGDATVGVIWAK